MFSGEGITSAEITVVSPESTFTKVRILVVILSHYALILFVVILCTHTICGYLVSLVAF